MLPKCYISITQILHYWDVFYNGYIHVTFPVQDFNISLTSPPGKYLREFMIQRLDI